MMAVSADSDDDHISIKYYQRVKRGVLYNLLPVEYMGKKKCLLLTAKGIYKN
jgi:hypothetical protein